MKLKEILIATAALGILGALTFVWLSPTGVPAPNIRMVTTQNQVIRLAELRGHPVLVTFWATTCPTCVAEIPHISRLYRRFGPKGLHVIGVSMYYDPPSQVVKMIKRRDIPYPVVTDVTKKIVQAFHMQRIVTPTSYLIAPNGRIVLQKVGFLDMNSLRARIQRMLARNAA